MNEQDPWRSGSDRQRHLRWGASAQRAAIPEQIWPAFYGPALAQQGRTGGRGIMSSCWLICPLMLCGSGDHVQRRYRPRGRRSSE